MKALIHSSVELSEVIESNTAKFSPYMNTSINSLSNLEVWRVYTKVGPILYIRVRTI